LSNTEASAQNNKVKADLQLKLKRNVTTTSSIYLFLVD